jgi:hypothetical protein
MNPSHESMRIVPSNQPVPQSLSCSAMDTHEKYESEGRSVAALVVVMVLVFSAYFGLRVAMPELPLHVHQALAWLPL